MSDHWWTASEEREATRAAIAERLARESVAATVARLRQEHRPQFDTDGDDYRQWKIGPYCAECDEWPCDTYMLTYRRRDVRGGEAG